ncbi:MAG: hypothetical protein WA775_02885 [Psychroserpens sp.]|uniref:hypothetical protein n=1 Tax=Psychroserpens sp. TaxID=2020870 RepID=UPI003C839BE3
MSTETLDIKALSADQKAELMAQLEAEAKAEKQKKKDDRKAYKSLTHEFVNRNIDALVNHNKATEDIIIHLFNDYEPVKELKQEIYGADPQDSHTSTLEDGSSSITIGYNVSIKFDGTETIGVQKIKDYMASLSDANSGDNTKKLAKAVETYLKINPKTKMLNPSRIIELSKLREEFNDEEFDDGIDIIFNAQIRTQNGMYVSGWKYIMVDNMSKKLTFRFSV